jgi:hypothetical protein
MESQRENLISWKRGAEQHDVDKIAINFELCVHRWNNLMQGKMVRET